MMMMLMVMMMMMMMVLSFLNPRRQKPGVFVQTGLGFKIQGFGFWV
jgi:lipopolysaccharide export LptBFGC system permease protein LptF